MFSELLNRLKQRKPFWGAIALFIVAIILLVVVLSVSMSSETQLIIGIIAIALASIGCGMFVYVCLDVKEEIEIELELERRYDSKLSPEQRERKVTAALTDYMPIYQSNEGRTSAMKQAGIKRLTNASVQFSDD